MEIKKVYIIFVLMKNETNTRKNQKKPLFRRPQTLTDNVFVTRDFDAFTSQGRGL